MIHHGDLFDVIPTLAAASIDACVTDPPYGIGFMGREWDTFKPGVEQSRIIPNRAIESENPNLKGRTRGPASSPSAVEYDRSLSGQREFQEWTRRWSAEVYRVLKPGAYAVVCGAPRSHHRMMCGIEDAGFVVRDCFAWLFGSGFPKNKNLGDGRGTALKPAHEPIALAWKPFKGSISGNVAQFGTGALNIDACRIAYEDAADFASALGGNSAGANNDRVYEGGWPAKPQSEKVSMIGRWPANVLLGHSEDCGDDADGDWHCVSYCPVRLLDEQTGDLGFSSGNETKGEAHPHGIYGSRMKQGRDEIGYLDRGGASRFYYVAKPSREERDYGTHGLTARQRDDSRKEGHPGGDNPRNRGLQPRGNFHPTVKPVELMRWLVKLVTPLGGTVLDPFTGSGTTGMACRYELREFVGIEREAEYLAIAERRIAAVAPLFGETA